MSKEIDEDKQLKESIEVIKNYIDEDDNRTKEKELLKKKKKINKHDKNKEIKKRLIFISNKIEKKSFHFIYIYGILGFITVLLFISIGMQLNINSKIDNLAKEIYLNKSNTQLSYKIAFEKDVAAQEIEKIFETPNTENIKAVQDSKIKEQVEAMDEKDKKIIIMEK